MRIGLVLATVVFSGAAGGADDGKTDAEAEEVTVKIPVLGAYSRTWPLRCAKSEKIVRGFADYLIVEAGGFSTRNPADWQSPWCVMKRARE